VEQYYVALVGTLKAAKKKGLIQFKGQILLKGMHDQVQVSIVNANVNVNATVNGNENDDGPSHSSNDFGKNNGKAGMILAFTADVRRIQNVQMKKNHPRKPRKPHQPPATTTNKFGTTKTFSKEKIYGMRNVHVR